MEAWSKIEQSFIRFDCDIISRIRLTTQLLGLVTRSPCKIISTGLCFAFLRNYIFNSDQNVNAKSNRNRDCIFSFPWESKGSQVGLFLLYLKYSS